MGIRIAFDPANKVACIYDSCTGTAFGPVFSGNEAQEEAESFCTYWQSTMPRLKVGFSAGPGGTPLNVESLTDLHRLWKQWSNWRERQQEALEAEYGE